jgi:glycosyltransferase involved in cell wall biosynthesis
MHGRLDGSGIPDLLDEFDDVPLVAISDSQRRWSPRANWVATIHHGLPLTEVPFRREPGAYLALVGRIAPEKGVAEAIELARTTGLRLRLAAKVYDDAERSLFDRLVRPAVDEGVVEYLGELGPDDRDEVLAGARATLMLGAWPEPFGLVAIESMAAGTPVIARRAGALPELVDHFVDGFLVDDLGEARLAVARLTDLDRPTIRRRAVERFSVERMTDRYESVYRRLAASRVPVPVASARHPVPVPSARPAGPGAVADSAPVGVAVDPRAG